MVEIVKAKAVVIKAVVEDTTIARVKQVSMLLSESLSVPMSDDPFSLINLLQLSSSVNSQ